MCGIFGINFKPGRLSAARRAVLTTNLARFNDTRGGDSWGVAGIKGNSVNVSRGLGDLSDRAYELCDYDVLFAHTRYATHGETTVANAHPFRIGNVLGAHNGMIYNHHQLCKEYKRSFEVDSMHLFAHLNNGLPFDDVEGYGAIEWIYRNNPQNIYLSKMRGGELAIYGIGSDKNLDGIVWSSSWRHLLKALSCAGIDKYFRYDIKTGHVYYASGGKLFVASKKIELAKPVFSIVRTAGPMPEMTPEEYDEWKNTRDLIDNFH